MSIFSLFKGQANKDEAGTVLSGSGVAKSSMPLELKAISYLRSLINREESITEILTQFAEAKNLPDLECEKVYIKTYYGLERFISQNKPIIVKRILTKEEIRQEIRKNLDILKAHLSFRLIFLLDNEQSLALFELSISNFVQQILINLGVDRLKKVGVTLIKGSILEQVKVTDKGLDFGPLYKRINQVDKVQFLTSLKSFYNALYQEIVNSFGKNMAGNLVEKNYAFIKDSYEYEVVAHFLNLLPEGILEGERVTYLTREELEQQAKKGIEEKAKREIAEETAQKMKSTIEELDKTKRAMLNLLEDAKKLEEDLKKEKAGVEQKVTERTLELEEEKTKLQASISSLSIGFVMIDVKNNILLINQSARDILCTSSSSPLATVKECTLNHIEDELKGIIDLRSLINRCISGKKVLLIKEMSFESRYIKLLLTPIIEGSLVLGAVLLVEDITEAKVLERSRDEFFSIASHELRTPLTVISGNLDTVMAYGKSKIVPEDKQLLSDTLTASDRLINIVNDFLNVSRIDQGRLVVDIQPMNILKLIEDVVLQLIPLAKEKQLDLKYEYKTDEKEVLADTEKVREVLINLLGNSIKFTTKGFVKIVLSSKDNQMVVSIEDTGMGVPKDRQNLLFHRFQQAMERTLARDIGGTGLGLYISREFIKHMGGDLILVKSEEGKGSVFSFTLPLAKQAIKV